MFVFIIYYLSYFISTIVGHKCMDNGHCNKNTEVFILCTLNLNLGTYVLDYNNLGVILGYVFNAYLDHLLF